METKDFVLEYLIRCRNRQTLSQICGALHCDRKEVEQALEELRKTGVVATTSTQYRWWWDGDFQCAECTRDYPEVKRHQSRSICVQCYVDKSSRGAPSSRSRFCKDEGDSFWDKKFCQEFLSRPLL